jgi:hypothetical protein
MKVINTHARLIVAAVLAATASGTNAIAGELRLTPGVNEVPTKETDPRAQFTEAQVRATLADVEGVELPEASDAEVKTDKKEPVKAPAAPAKTTGTAAAPAAASPSAPATTAAKDAAAAGGNWSPAKT